MADLIRLKDITVFGFYGVSPAEREVGQKIQIDLDLSADLTSACRSDSLHDTINYESVYSKVIEVVGGEKRYRLLEALGDEICAAIIARRQQRAGPVESQATHSLQVTAAKLGPQAPGIQIP